METHIIHPPLSFSLPFLRKELLSERDGNKLPKNFHYFQRFFLRKELLSERDGNLL